jgi:hypothetical protein
VALVVQIELASAKRFVLVWWLALGSKPPQPSSITHQQGTYREDGQDPNLPLQRSTSNVFFVVRINYGAQHSQSYTHHLLVLKVTGIFCLAHCLPWISNRGVFKLQRAQDSIFPNIQSVFDHYTVTQAADDSVQICNKPLDVLPTLEQFFSGYLEYRDRIPSLLGIKLNHVINGVEAI